MEFKSKIVAAGLCIACAVSFALPAIVSADNDKNKNEQKEEKLVKKLEKSVKKELKKEEQKQKKEERKEEIAARRVDREEWKENRNCVDFFGLIVSKGWFNKQAEFNVDSNCRVPFGIWKKIFGNGTTATTTTDTTAPVITNIIPRTGNTFAVIAWNTNEKASSKLYWSASSTVGISNSSVKIVTSGKSESHLAIITGLSASTTYYGRVEAKDASGNTSTSSVFSFVTSGTGVVVPDTTAPVLSSITPADVGTSTLKVNWNTNEPATSKLYYSTSTPLNVNSGSTFLLSSSFVTSHSINVSGLATGTLHYFVIESKDSSGNTATSSQFATTTLGI